MRRRIYMVKVMHSSPGSLTRTFKNWLMELAETEMTFDILRKLRSETQSSNQQVQQSSKDPSEILSYVQLLKDLPEEDRQIALALLQSLNAPPPQQNVSVKPAFDPTLLILMMMLKENKSNDNPALAEAIKGQYAVLTELIRNLSNRNDGETAKLLLEALDKLKPTTNPDEFKDELAKMAISALIEAATKDDSSEIDRMLQLMEKLKVAGLIIDPKTSLTYQLEKEKMDKEFKLKEREMELEEKRMEQISQFLADFAEALESLTEKEAEEKGIEKKPTEYTVKCPKCGESIKVSTSMKEGSIIQCKGCGAKLRLKWR